MPRLSELTDFDPMGSFVGAQPTADPTDTPSTPISNNVDKILNSLFRDDEKRLQLWPEKLLRSGTTAAGNVMSGEIPQWAVDPKTGDVHTSPQMVEAAQEMSALAGTGGLGSGGGTLNATPSLRPALKYKDKLYKGKPGQEHQDLIPQDLYPEFQKMAMSGEDISHYNFGFVNDKGHFLDREQALKYGVDNGLVPERMRDYGALTSTFLADSSKPGTAIESVGKSQPKLTTRKNGQYEDFDLKIGNSTARYSEHPDYFEIQSVRTPSKYRRQGEATKAMEYITDQADAVNKPIRLIASGLDKKTSTQSLVNFYKKHGFDVEYNSNGKINTANMAGDPWMIRNAQDKNLKADTPALPPGYELKPVEFNPFELKS